MLLLDVINETFLKAAGEKLTIIAALAYFLYYFMRELKELRKQHDTTRKEYEEKMERIMERLLKVEENSRTVLERTNESSERLADAVDKLTAKINSSSPKL